MRAFEKAIDDNDEGALKLAVAAAVKVQDDVFTDTLGLHAHGRFTAKNGNDMKSAWCRYPEAYLDKIWSQASLVGSGSNVNAALGYTEAEAESALAPHLIRLESLAVHVASLTIRLRAAAKDVTFTWKPQLRHISKPGLQLSLCKASATLKPLLAKIQDCVGVYALAVKLGVQRA